MTVDQLYKYHTVIFMYKYTTKQLPNNFNELFTRNNQTRQYNTRQTDGYRHNMHKQTITSFSVKTQGPLIWNKFTNEIKDSKSLYTLKAKLRQNNHTL